MKILICGASGFVGKHLTHDLRNAGHTVIRAVRRPHEPDDIQIDFCCDTNKEIWLSRLQGIDAVINAIGVLRDSADNPMQKLHTDTPVALFTACLAAGVKRIVHLSALGVDSGIDVPYFSTRLATEHALQALPVPYLCLRPSVIYGTDGTSAKMFIRMATLPVHALPMGGVQSLQPVHIDDISAAVANWLSDPEAASQTIEAVGSAATSMRGMLDSYRKQLHRRAAWHLAIPASLVRLMALAGDYIPASPMCSDTYAMLKAGNTASATKFAGMLRREPRSYTTFIA